MNSWAFNICTVLNLLHLLFIFVLRLLYLWPLKLACKYFLRIFFWLFDLKKKLSIFVEIQFTYHIFHKVSN